jgi:demethylmenaquinone methyltransferase/2-methoxy-6-polyprenyl-1,4-benzoquinol methylase
MFNRIARRYDLLNRLLSFGQDQVWRKRLSRYLNTTPNQMVLDVATGTGDVLLMLANTNKNIMSGIGVDTADQMLAIGWEKIKHANPNASLRLEHGDATRLQFADNSFDAATIAFGIRNVQNVTAALREMHRVVKPNGKCLILEFSLPSNKIVRAGYLFYFRNVLPVIGGLISGDKAAYSYLNKTVETFPYGDTFCQLMHEAGFTTVTPHQLTFGVATIYEATKA